MQNDVYTKARRYLYRNARPLDMARFQYHFEQGSRDAVLDVLACYQNADGGLGHAVEADCWNPNSTPLHISTACTIIREIDCPNASHPVIQGILRYLAGGEHFNGRSWNLVVKSNNDYPHAPWWHTESDSACHTDYNGTAEIAGFLVRYADRDSDLFRLGIRIAREAVEALSKAELLDMHTCGCYIHMADWIEKANVTGYLDHRRLKEKLHEAVHRLIESDVEKWGNYVCKPSDFINTAESEFYAVHKEVAEYECEYIINTQLEDGSWKITWSWADFPSEWAVSKNWWKGDIIIKNLLYLKGFRRL